ncbi:hypothetical protein [Pararhizobium arenae]|uniref:hypothetical protein n=1 Tax=Pararhizobium arenae TaxID=1856850 RepID=UPI00094AC9F1|nr:hypothetical protein [Pararhizobium arenae]
MAEKSYLEYFAGKRIFIIDAGYFLTDEVRAKLEAFGAQIVVSSARSKDALLLLRNTVIDAAILDIHLRDEVIFPIVESLELRNVPFIFATSQSPVALAPRFTGFRMSVKREDLEDIARAVFAPEDRRN